MTAIINPKTTFSILPAEQVVRLGEQKVLIVGQMLATGTATPAVLAEDIPNDETIISTWFGERSHIAGMIRAFFRENKVTRLDALPLAEVTTGTVAESAVFINATASSTGILTVSVGSENDHTYSVDVVTGDLPQTIADNLKALIDADTKAPFVTVSQLDAVEINSSAHGTIHNDWDIRVIENTANVDYALTAWINGTGVPTVPDLNVVLGEIRYQTIVWSSAIDISTDLEPFLDARFNYANLILDGVGIQVKKGTLSELKTYADQNSQSIVIIGNKPVSESDREGTAIPEMPDIIASEMAAIRALRLTNSALLTNYITSVAPLDQYGGIGIASLPYFNTRLPNIKPGYEQDTWIQEDQDELIDNGISLIGPNVSFSEVIFGTQVTTYLTDAVSNPDDSYHFLNTVDTASAIREFFYVNCRSRYSQTRLTKGDLEPGRDFANLGSIRAFLNELYDELADEGLVQKSRAAKKDFNDNLIISIDLEEGKVNISMAPILVSQIRVILGTIQINFG